VLILFFLVREPKGLVRLWRRAVAWLIRPAPDVARNLEA